MSKDTLYFKHDTNARGDRKMVKLAIKHGLAGIGAYWCIIEMLYEEGGYMPLEYERISFELRTSENIVQDVINDFELFKSDKKQFWSERVLDELKERCEKSEKARQSIEKRWLNKRNTNVIRTKYGGNTKRGEERREDKENKKYNAAFDLWLKYKSERKQAYKSDLSRGEAFSHLMKLADNNEETAMLIVKQSIANNWSGLFALKQESKGSPEELSREEIIKGSEKYDGKWH